MTESLWIALMGAITTCLAAVLGWWGREYRRRQEMPDYADGSDQAKTQLLLARHIIECPNMMEVRQELQAINRKEDEHYESLNKRLDDIWRELGHRGG